MAKFKFVLFFFLLFTIWGTLRCLGNNYTSSDSSLIILVDAYLKFLDIFVVWGTRDWKKKRALPNHVCRCPHNWKRSALLGIQEVFILPGCSTSFLQVPGNSYNSVRRRWSIRVTLDNYTTHLYCFHSWTVSAGREGFSRNVILE